MFLEVLKKDLKMVFANKTNILMIFLVAPLLIIVFSYTMKNFMSNSFNTFKDGKVLYYVESETNIDKFNLVKDEITKQTQVIFEEVYDYDRAVNDVNKSEAYAIIKISDSGYDYYRSPYNEPNGGAIIRSLFTEMVNNNENKNIVIEQKIDVKKPDSSVYYTFGGLSLAILLLGFILAPSLTNDRLLGVDKRIGMSYGGAKIMVFSKVCIGLICALLTMIVGLLTGMIVFKIKFENYFGLIMLTFIMLCLFVASTSVFFGTICRNSSIAMTCGSLLAMMSGYLGGSITPVYILERTPVIKYLIKISPLYWTNQSLANLYNNILDSKTTNSFIVITILSISLIIISLLINYKRYYASRNNKGGEINA